MNHKPFLLRPTGKDYLWGGKRLNDEFEKNIPMSPLAETWECSTHPDGPSWVVGGEFDGVVERCGAQIHLQRRNELEGHAAAGQLLEGIGAVGASGIDDGAGGGQLGAAFVMVGDDGIQPLRLRRRDLIDGGDAGIDGDHQRAAVRGEVF